MAEDFRGLLKERMRIDETGERWFDDLDIGGAFYLSIQASTLHDSTPMALLDDVNGYEAFQVILQIKQGVFVHGRRGAWQFLEELSWWPLFAEDTPIVRVAERVPAATVQQVFEDLTACVAAHPEMVIKRGCALKTC